jgi:hypothetical protein
VLLCEVASAQTFSNLSGVVVDPDGGGIAGARITAKHAATGLARAIETEREGRFYFPGLPEGDFELRVEANGFRSLIRKGLHLDVNQTTVVELALEIGAIDQEVTVTAAATPVNTSSGELGYLVSARAIEELPLNGRNYTDLALLQPGVVAYPHRDGGSVVAYGLGISVNGQDPRSNTYLLDGTTQNNFLNGPAGSAAGTVLGTESIQEFRVEVNSYSAEFGRNMGGQINVLTKSGSNQLHGSAYYFLRNDNLDARNFFDGKVQPEFQRNQFGASLGGPVRRGSSFFFFGYEGLRERLGRTISSNVPDDNAHAGFLPDPANPGSLVNVGVNPGVQPYLDEFPRPNGQALGGGLAVYTFGFQQRLDADFVQGRFDRNVGSKGQFFARYTFDDASQFLPMDFPQFPRTFYSRNQFVTAEYRHVHSPRTLSTVRASFSRTRLGQTVRADTAKPLQPFVPGRSMVGSIDIGGIPRFGTQSSVDFRNAQNVWGIEPSLTLIRGKHQLIAGMVAEHYQCNMVNPTFGLGIYTFGDLRDFLQNRAQQFLGLTPEGQLDRYWRFALLGFFVQDNYRVNQRLVLNLGLRYEFTTTPYEIYGRDVALMDVYKDATTVIGQLYENPTLKNFSPRFGFAWDVFGNGRSSLRGGYGMFYNTNNQQNLVVTVTNAPFTPRVVIANPTFPNPPFERGIGNTLRPIEFNLKNPYAGIWNLNWQQQLRWDILVTAGYAGSRGVHLLRNTDINTAVPERLADGTLFFPVTARRQNPNYGTIELKRSDGNSWYNAALLEVRKRFGGGLTFQSSYTFSRNIDTTQASTFFSDATNGTTSALPEFPGFQYNKGLADYHAKHNWLLNFTWMIPFTHRLSGVPAVLLDGWELAGITNLRSGTPLTVFVNGNPSRSQWAPAVAPGLGRDRVSMAPGRTHENAVTGNPERWFDPAAFVPAAPGTLGNAGRGTFIGPNLRSVDLAALKNFRAPFLGETGRIQFRAEGFNLANRANFGIPGLQAFSGTAPIASLGRIRNTVTTARQIQFALRFAF